MGQSIMKDSKKYFKDINKLFPVHSNKEKKYLNDLKEQVDEYDNLSYQAVQGDEYPALPCTGISLFPVFVNTKPGPGVC